MSAMKMDRPPEPMSRISPNASSTSDSGSDSGTDSDSTSEDSGDENVNQNKQRILSPVPVEQPTASPKTEEEAKPRWNLASYLDQNGVKTEPVPSPQLPITSPLQTSNVLSSNQKRIASLRNDDDDSEGSDSTKEFDNVLAEAKASKPEPLLSSFSDSDSSTKKKYVKKRKRVPVQPPTINVINGNASDSDSDEFERIPKVHKPVNRVSPKTKLPAESSDSDDKITLHGPDNGKTWTIASAVPPDKPKSRRGRPRKQPANDKRPGRPPNSTKKKSEDVKRKKFTKRESSSDSDGSVERRRLSYDSDRDDSSRNRKKSNYKPAILDSDHEDWSERKKKCYNHLFDNNTKKIDYNNVKKRQTNRSKRKSKDISQEMLPTTTDTDSDSESNNNRVKKPPPIPTYDSTSSDSDNAGRSSDSDRNHRLSNGGKDKGKLENDCKSVQDKKKCDTLKKLFIQKRDSEGGKGALKKLINSNAFIRFIQF